jgi:hypothetical protein
MMNLALAGYADSAMICAWLLCREVVMRESATSSANVPHFERTWRAQTETPLP